MNDNDIFVAKYKGMYIDSSVAILLVLASVFSLSFALSPYASINISRETIDEATLGS